MECNPSLVSWGDASIIWIAEHLRQPWLDPIMHFFSSLGETGAILFAIAAGYWLWEKRALRAIGYALFSAILANVWIKGIFMECRPPDFLWIDTAKDLHKSFSFPSGHAQAGIVLWVGLAYYMREYKASMIFVLVALLVGLSRP